METIAFNFKLDLDRMSDSDVRRLARYYSLRADSMNDLRWLIALKHASNSASTKERMLGGEETDFKIVLNPFQPAKDPKVYVLTGSANEFIVLNDFGGKPAGEEGKYRIFNTKGDKEELQRALSESDDIKDIKKNILSYLLYGGEEYLEKVKELLERLDDEAKVKELLDYAEVKSKGGRLMMQITAPFISRLKVAKLAEVKPVKGWVAGSVLPTPFRRQYVYGMQDTPHMLVSSIEEGEDLDLYKGSFWGAWNRAPERQKGKTLLYALIEKERYDDVKRLLKFLEQQMKDASKGLLGPNSPLPKLLVDPKWSDFKTLRDYINADIEGESGFDLLKNRDDPQSREIFKFLQRRA